MSNRSALYPLLEGYLEGDIPLLQLRGSFYSGDMEIEPAEEGLYQAVSMHLAMYTVGDWPEDVLRDALRWHLDRYNGRATETPVPMMDRQWVEIMASGIAPWPLKTDSHQRS